MKKTFILSLVVVFALALFAPAIVNAMDNSTVIVNVDDTKKTEKKADEKKASCSDTKKAGCTDAKKADCTSTKAEAKSCCSEKKVEGTEKKAEVKK